MDLPKFVDDDPATILAEIIADFETLSGKTLLPSQPEYLLCSAMAYRVVLERNRQNATGKSQLVAFSTAPIIDYLAQLVGVTRIPAAQATCQLQFTLISGHGDLIIPFGTRVISTDGLAIFETLEDMPVASGVLTATVNAICQTAGGVGNNYAIGDINVIQDPQPYISSCQNIDITAGGSDEETDDQLRARIFIAPSQFSVAGPKKAYEFFTFSVSPLIVSVSVISMTEDITIPAGEVDIYPLLANGNMPDSTLIDLIQAALSDEKIRPLTDTPVVKAPTQVQFTVTVNITKYPTYANSAITTPVTSALNAFRQAKIEKMGLDIINSEIEALCRVEGVYDLEVIIVPVGKSLTGDNLVLAANEFGYMSDFTINITGSNNG